MNPALIKRVVAGHREKFGGAPGAAAYAPGRIEVLGNHTDYNEGFVLSAAISSGLCAAAALRGGQKCFLAAMDLGETAEFELPVNGPLEKPHWANYLVGVAGLLAKEGRLEEGFSLAFAGDVPRGAGLSSSAALEVAAALALGKIYDIRLSKIQMARLCQKAENEFTGAKCGLLDQISSIYGKEDHLVFTDFRTLAVENDPIGKEICFLMANTRVKHSLVESDYNERRAACEKAAAYFASVLAHPVKALRDVSSDELNNKSSGLDPVILRRAKHIIGENERVLKARGLLKAGRTKEFGKLMFASHESSRVNFENSCPELDFSVNTAADMREVLGARLSGGGFGGSAVLLVNPKDISAVKTKIISAYDCRFGSSCSIEIVRPSAGAALLP